MPVHRVPDAELEAEVEKIDQSIEAIVSVHPYTIPVSDDEYGVSGWVIVTNRPRTIGDQIAEYRRGGDAA